MKDTVPIDQAGRIVLPKAMRQELAIQSGDLLEVSIEGMKITLVPKTPGSSLVKKGRGLVFSAATHESLSTEETNKVVQAERDERSRELLAQASRKKR